MQGEGKILSHLFGLSRDVVTVTVELVHAKTNIFIRSQRELLTESGHWVNDWKLKRILEAFQRPLISDPH